MKNVVITDYTFDDLSIEKNIFDKNGIKLTSEKSPSKKELIELTKNADYIITQFAKLETEIIDNLLKAKIIVRYGVGYDNVDIEKAKSKNIPVCNVPDYCVDEVADHTLAFILNLTRGITKNHQKVADGSWGLGIPLCDMKSLNNMNIGIIGYGRIGQAVVDRLIPFKANILISDPFCTSPINKSNSSLVDISYLLKNSDIISLHCPSTEKTKNIINKQSLSLMKKGVSIINLGRGDLIDMDSLINYLNNKTINYVALDVFDIEPLVETHPIRYFDNVLLSSHVASASIKAVQKLRQSAAELIIKCHNNEKLKNIVN
jgi:D-3-phosphoglycerate dehydrogenase|tara:strand:+ start:868 stop:1818 length:951 start_codon:yes stop_codon:yes gene_type:complete